MKELCGRCGHGMHGDECQHVVKRMVPSEVSLDRRMVMAETECQCPAACRTDLLACRQLEQIIQHQRATIELLMLIHDIEVDDETGLPRRKPIATEVTH